VVATPHRTAVENLGRRVYIREGCWYLPFAIRATRQSRYRTKWGPVSQAGGVHLRTCRKCSAHDGNRSRICRARANRRSDEWHYAHHWDPRAVEPRVDDACLFPGCSPRTRSMIARSTAFIEAYDKNHDGRVTKSEIGCPRAEAREFFAELDTWPVKRRTAVMVTASSTCTTTVPVSDGRNGGRRGVHAEDWNCHRRLADLGGPGRRRAVRRPNEPPALRESRGKAIYRDQMCRLSRQVRQRPNYCGFRQPRPISTTAYHFSFNPQPRDFTTKRPFKKSHHSIRCACCRRTRDIFRTIFARCTPRVRSCPAWGNGGRRSHHSGTRTAGIWSTT